MRGLILIPLFIILSSCTPNEGGDKMYEPYFENQGYELQEYELGELKQIDFDKFCIPVKSEKPLSLSGGLSGELIGEEGFHYLSSLTYEYTEYDNSYIFSYEEDIYYQQVCFTIITEEAFGKSISFRFNSSGSIKEYSVRIPSLEETAIILNVPENSSYGIVNEIYWHFHQGGYPTILQSIPLQGIFNSKEPIILSTNTYTEYLRITEDSFKIGDCYKPNWTIPVWECPKSWVEASGTLEELSKAQTYNIKRIYFEDGFLKVILRNPYQKDSTYDLISYEKNISKVKHDIISRSRAYYINATGGNCPCPYDVAKNGSLCGGRSAYSRPGGFDVKCYESEVGLEEALEELLKMKSLTPRYRLNSSCTNDICTFW